MQDVQSRNQDAIRSLGSITMFAALAGWETNLRAVLTARLDTLEISDLIGHVFACISSEQPMDSHRVLSELLIEKAKYTHVTNIECFGLRNLSETIAGALQTSLNSTARAEQWLRIRDVLRRSVDVLEQAIALPNQRQRYVTEAVGLVAEAGRMIDCVNG